MNIIRAVVDWLVDGPRSETVTAPRRGIKALLARRPLASYFIIAYAFSWLAWMPLVLSKDGAGLLSYRNPIGFYTTLAIASFGPSLSAFIMTGLTEGRMGVGRLLRQLVLWRVGLRWYLFALVGLPAIMVLSVIFLPGALASWSFGREPDPRAHLGILAPAHILDSGLEFSAHHPQHPHVCRSDCPIHDCHDVGLQQHEGEPVHRYLGAQLF
jgi:hypothetical protein